MSLALYITVLLAAVAVAAPSGDDHDDCKAKMQAYATKCKAELKITDDAEVEGWMKMPPYDSTLNQCYVKCIAENFGVFKDGKVDEDKVMKIINKGSKGNADRREKDLSIMNQCKTLKGKDDCETAAKIYTCAMEAAQKSKMTM